jgi:ASC-1-like (ASCH) protein
MLENKRKDIVLRDFEMKKGDIMEFEKTRLKININRIQKGMSLQMLEINCYLLFLIDLNQLS